MYATGDYDGIMFWAVTDDIKEQALELRHAAVARDIPRFADTMDTFLECLVRFARLHS